MKKLNVAVIGQGRSGKDIHGTYFESADNTLYNVKYVVDADEVRRRVAKETYGCEVFENYEEILDKKDIDLVVNASFSQMHYPITKDLLMHKFNVLCEKPMAGTRYECEDLVKTAKENGVVYSVFHQTLVAPFYVKAKEIINNGLIGDVKFVSLKYSSFARRWDWQTLQKNTAGGLYNTGPHPVGIAMDLLDFDDKAKVEFAYLDCAFTSGDGDDMAKVIVTAPGKPVIDIEVMSNDAFVDYNMKVHGTKGCFRCNGQKIEGKYMVDGENPERPVIEEFLWEGENKKPVYPSETLITHEISEEITDSVFGYSVVKIYENLYNAITCGEELISKPEDIAKVISIIEQAHALNPLPLKF